MLVLQRSRQSRGYCDMLEISGRTKILNQGFAVSWSSAHSITVVLTFNLSAFYNTYFVSFAFYYNEIKSVDNFKR